jgi:light-regulated signal transduction histidine kinase (bacteriophytochrome)
MSSIGQELRHRLRTPLNHIVGYSEMLLEEFEPEDVSEIPVRLRNICAAAHALLTVLSRAAEEAYSPEPRVHLLRSGMLPFLYEISQNVGELLRETAENMTLDLLRIGSATAELMAFAQDRTPAKQSRTPMRREPASGRTAPGGASVLVVDDDEANRDLLSRQLQRLGYSVVCAGSGPEALTELKARRFEVALVDFMMPGMDGLEVLEQMKDDPATNDVPVIMISALDEISGVTHCIERGAEDYLFKPFDPVLLSARINAAIERTRLRLSQRERTEELERFAYMASHDLQAPLRTITAYLQLIEKRLAKRLSPDERALIDFPIDAAQRMSQLIKDLLTFSQVNTEERELTLVNCGDVLASTLDDLAAIISEAGAVVTSDALPTAPADEVQLRQLFLNLIGNALKYRREEPPRIHVGVRREPAAWHFTVADNGLGIPPEHLKDIFNVFRRLHGEDRPGTGLGLAICKRIMERLGGQIWVESQQGAGSTFHFTIPDVAHAPAYQSEITPTASLSSESSPA